MYDYDASTTVDRWSRPPQECPEGATAPTERDEALPQVNKALLHEAQLIDATPTVKEQSIVQAEPPSGTFEPDTTAKDIDVLGRKAARKVREHEAAASADRDGSTERASDDHPSDGEPGTEPSPHRGDVESLPDNEAPEAPEGKHLKRLLSSYLDEQE